MFPKLQFFVIGERPKHGSHMSFAGHGDGLLFAIRVQGLKMDSTRWDRIQTIFHGAADLPKSQQRAYLESACAGDETLAADVQALLDEDAKSSSLLDRDMADVAHEVLDDPHSRALPFKEFGPYRFVRLLGEGGMGVVYLAERTDLRSLVAVKVLRDAWVSPARRERFLSEQQTLAQLNHPSIARLYDADTLPDGTPLFVMEYVEGASLIDYCGAHGCSIDERLKLFRSVCEAVQYAHGHAVIHRDLKPSNILVKTEGSIRLLDFGIAKQLESVDAPADLTRTGLRFMTPAYAAPELIRGDRVGIQSDVYSLGVILYELLSGRLPFDVFNRTPAEAETAILENEPVKPSVAAQPTSDSVGTNSPAISVSKAGWTDLDVLCLTAMHKDPERRYRSVEALIRDIDHYRKREPLDARPDNLRYRVEKFVTRNWRSVAAAAAVAAIVVGLVVFYTLRLAKARNAALAEASRTQRIEQFMQDLFQGDAETTGPADDLRVVTVLERGVKQARALDADPEIQADLYQTLGTMYDQLGKFDQADSLLKAALNQRKAVDGPDSAKVAESLVALAYLRGDQAQLEEAEQLARQGLDMSKRHLPPDSPIVARATTTLGRTLDNRGKYDEAIPILEEAVRLQSGPNGVRADLSATLGELANTHYYLGHYDISKSLNERALEMDEQIYGDRNPNVAQDLTNLADIQYQWSHFADAERLQRKALDIMQAWYGTEHPETADDMTILGKYLIAEGRADEAATILRESLAVAERTYGKVHPRVAFAVGELGAALQQEGKLDEAEADFRRQAEIYKSVYGEKNQQLGAALANLAGVYADRKDYAKAERLYGDVLNLYAEVLPPGHLNIAITRVKLGGVLLHDRRYADAETESLLGYDLLLKQSTPPARWVLAARTDLVAEYGALNQAEKAAKIRAQLVGSSTASVPTPAKN
jgi:serine/threonine protein kinase/tetratricopeptide (TPR) repeat protein